MANLTGKSFGLWKWVSIVSVAIVFFSFIFGAVQSGIYGVNTGDYKPLAKNTIGKAVASDVELYDNLAEYSQTSNDKYKGFLRNSIVMNIVFILFNFFLGYFLIRTLFGIFLSDNNFNIGMHLLFILIGGILIIASGIIYNGVVYSNWDFPFTGLRALISNFDILWEDATANMVIEVQQTIVNNVTNVTGV